MFDGMGESTIRGRLLVALLVAAVVVIAAPAAGAKECGAQIIDQYFNTGKLAEYHSQDCYASALRQVDPDARMYSGIMGAIRAARARDKAADSKPPDKEPTTAPTADADTPTPTPTPAFVAPEAVPVQGEEAAALPTPESDSLQREVRRIDLGATSVAEQAASPLPAVESHTPLIVVMLAVLALLLLLVGVGGVTARWLDRSP